MIFPRGTRNNSRYRGPIESKKFIGFYSDVRMDIDTIKAALDKVESDLGGIKNDINKTDNVILNNKVNTLFDKLNLLEGGK